MNSKTFTERGQALIIIALASVALIAIVGLAIDGSRKFSDMRHAQNAADTAALAAALAKVQSLTDGDSNSPADCPASTTPYSTVCTTLLSAGYFRAASNGYDNNLTTNTVEIYSPPISGPYVGLSNYVQVIINSYVDTTFARVIGVDQTHNIVQATTFIYEGGALAEGAMIVSYDPDPNCSTGGTGGYSVQVNGNAAVTLNGGGFFLNSDETCGFKIPNCADLNIVSGSINSAGNNIDTTGCTFDPPVTTNINQDPVLIPDEVRWPDVPTECGMSGSPSPTYLGTVIVDGKEVEEWLIYPGFYTDFPQATLLPTAEEVDVGKRSRIYMKSGVYCIDPPMSQDLSWSPIAASLLNGSTDPAANRFQDSSDPDYQNFNPDGVTLYIRSGGGFTINASSPTYLDASTSGDYQGYLIILEGTHTDIQSCNITGGADIDINGLIYAPYCDITVNGQAGEAAAINAQLIGWDIKVNGNNEIQFNYDPSNEVIISSQVGLMK